MTERNYTEATPVPAMLRMGTLRVAVLAVFHEASRAYGIVQEAKRYGDHPVALDAVKHHQGVLDYCGATLAQLSEAGSAIQPDFAEEAGQVLRELDAETYAWLMARGMQGAFSEQAILEFCEADEAETQARIAAQKAALQSALDAANESEHHDDNVVPFPTKDDAATPPPPSDTPADDGETHA